MYTKNLVSSDPNKFTEIFIDIPVKYNFSLFSNEARVKKLINELRQDNNIRCIAFNELFPEAIGLHFSFYINDTMKSHLYAVALGVYLYEKYGVEIDLFESCHMLKWDTKKQIYIDLKIELFEDTLFLEAWEESTYQELIDSWKPEDEDWIFLENEDRFFRVLRSYMDGVKKIADSINYSIGPKNNNKLL